MTDEIRNRIDEIRRGKVPNGYKKTKAGIIPVAWEIVKLHTISAHKTEKNKKLKYTETYTNSATQGIIKQTDYFDKQISNDDNIDGYYLVCKNDYVYNPRISVSAPCGPINKSHLEETGIMSPLYTVFRFKDEYEYTDYFEHYFKSSFWHRYMMSVANYGARHDRMNITNDDLFDMPIPFPPLPEQQKIAEILSTQDKLIELKQKLIEQKKQQKKYLMQQLITGKKRLKGFSGEWEKTDIKGCGEILTGNTPETKDINNYGGDYAWVTPSDITDNVFIFSSDKMLSEIGLSKSKRAAKGSVLVTCIASIGKNIILGCDASFNQQINAVTLYSNYNNVFFYYLICFNEKTIKKFAGKSATQIISKDKFANLVFKFPSLIEQTAIADVLLEQDKEIALFEKELEQEKQKKKSLMQLLMTGIVRVKT